MILQTKLRPLDQHGKLLGLRDECIERWPKYLPKTWKIAYYKDEGALRSWKHLGRGKVSHHLLEVVSRC